jgi:hypothetical protein
MRSTGPRLMTAGATADPLRSIVVVCSDLFKMFVSQPRSSALWPRQQKSCRGLSRQMAGLSLLSDADPAGLQTVWSAC